MDLINQFVDEMAKKKAQDIDDCIFNFLKANGFRPKRTEKYCRYLAKKLRKQGLGIDVEEIMPKFEFKDNVYSYSCVLVPKFVEVRKED